MPDLSPSLARVARGALCAGCGLCAALAPQSVAMTRSDAGYLRPKQSAQLSDKAEKTIFACCPALGQKAPAPLAGAARDPLWGQWLSMQQAWAKDPALRHAGASGGALSALAAELLARGLVQAVVQAEADPARPLGSRIRLSETGAEVAASAGSRYTPTAPLAGVLAALDAHQAIAFIGKPCDAAALRALISARPDLAPRIPYILSFFCAGVPSERGAEALSRSMGIAPADLAAFRYRGNGWPGEAVAEARDGRLARRSYAESWGAVLSKHLQHRCKICADGTGMAADIVCADAWEADANGYPRFTEAAGQSLVMARSAAGFELLKSAQGLEFAEFNPALLAAIQPGQRERRRALLARLIGLRLIGRPVPRYIGLDLWATARQNSLLKNIKAMLGMIRRARRGEA